jgi:hypothetical protein
MYDVSKIAQEIIEIEKLSSLDGSLRRTNLEEATGIKYDDLKSRTHRIRAYIERKNA